MRVFLLILLAGLVLGCAPKSVPLQGESINECDRLVAMTERVYFDKSSEELLAAATRLFQLTGGGFSVTRTTDGLTARRTWSPVASAKDASDGTDTWQLAVKEVTVCKGGSTVGYIEPVQGDPSRQAHGKANDCGASAQGIKLTVHHMPELYSQNLIATECFSSPVFKPAVSKFTIAPALYDLFFLRMDYLLGKSAQWPSCASYSEYVRTNVYYRDKLSTLNFRGHLDGLCAQGNDSAP